MKENVYYFISYIIFVNVSMHTFYLKIVTPVFHLRSDTKFPFLSKRLYFQALRRTNKNTADIVAKVVQVYHRIFDVSRKRLTKNSVLGALCGCLQLCPSVFLAQGLRKGVKKPGQGSATHELCDLGHPQPSLGLRQAY